MPTEPMPWFPMYADHFLTATLGWPAEAVGAYIRMLCVQWRQGGLSQAEATLRGIAGNVHDWEHCWTLIEPKIPIGDDGMRRNQRLEDVRAEQMARRETLAEAGRKGGEASARSQAKARPKRGSSQAKAKPKRPSSKGDIEDIPPIVPQGGTRKSRFESWYSAYPRKVGKDAALRKWEQRDKAGELPSLDEMLAALERQKRTDGWIQEAGKYIPHPSTYLNQGRWQDEVGEEQQEPPYFRKVGGG